jgi:hypothetical protein
MFEHVFFNCHNQTGTTITRGTVVMAVGALGASGRILIAPAIADGSVNSEYILGTAAMDISNGSDGLVYHFGKDRGLNTTGASCGETWADNDVLYCSATTPGCLTKVLPTAPNLKVPVAFVIRAGNNGTLFIRPSHFPDLNQINDVQLTSPTTGQTLIYNASTGVWSNQTPADTSSTNELQTLSTGTNTLTLSNGGGTVTVDTDPTNDVTGSGTSGQVSFWTGTQTQSGDNGLWWNNTTKRLGVGTNSPNSILNIAAGPSGVTPNTAGDDFVLEANTALGMSILGPNNQNGFLLWGSPSDSYGAGIYWNHDSDIFNIGTANSGASLNFQTANQVDAMRINSSGSVGIATTAPAARLHVVGAGSTSSTWTAQFHNSATGGNNALMIRDDGNIGIGTSTVPARLNIAAAGTSASVNAINTTNGTPSNIFAVRENGDIYGLSGIFYQASDGRLITDRIRSINTSTATILITGGNNGVASTQIGSWTTVTKTSGDYSLLTYNFGGFQPTSGNCRFSFQEFVGVINQTGGANGITRGMYINPSLTSAADWRSIEWSNNSGFGMYGNGTANNYLNGSLGIKTTSPTDLIDINGANGYSQLRLRTAYTPTGTADANGNTGDLSWDDNYIYIKTAAGWKRSTLSTF